MRTSRGRSRRFGGGIFALILAGFVSRGAGADTDRKHAAGRKYLAAVPSPESPEQMTSFLCISGAETVAGRTDEAADHFVRTVDYLARLTCQTQSPQHQVLAALISHFLQHMPPGSRGNMQVMLNEVWEAVSEKGRKPDTLASTHQGFSTVIAAGLAQLYYLSGADSVARTYAGEAVLSAPPVEVAEITYEGGTVCGCIRIQPFKSFWSGSSDSMIDDYIAYIRGRTHRFTHPPRALALLAGIEIHMKTRDDTRLRRAAFALEELRDRSLTTGSRDT